MSQFGRPFQFIVVFRILLFLACTVALFALAGHLLDLALFLLDALGKRMLCLSCFAYSTLFRAWCVPTTGRCAPSWWRWGRAATGWSGSPGLTSPPAGR